MRRQNAPPRRAEWTEAGLLFHCLNFFYQNRFGGKVWKLSLDAGCGCPNRDGTLATNGCIFCDPESFSPSRRLKAHGITEQLDLGVRRLRRRHGAERFVAYFQPGTNTYGPLDRLHAAYREAADYPGVVGLAIGTRPDCAGKEVLDILAELNARQWVVVEYGLQTIHDRSLDWLGRGHHADAFWDACRRTRRRRIDVGVHLILGLPGESSEDIRATARALAQCDIHSVKLHNLYAVRNTQLSDEVASGKVRLLEMDEYVGYIVDFLEELPVGVVVERLCGDAPPEYFLGPRWCLDKAAVRRAVEAEFRRRGTRQGCKTASSLNLEP